MGRFPRPENSGFGGLTGASSGPRWTGLWRPLAGGLCAGYSGVMELGLGPGSSTPLVPSWGSGGGSGRRLRDVRCGVGLLEAEAPSAGDGLVTVGDQGIAPGAAGGDRHPLGAAPQRPAGGYRLLVIGTGHTLLLHSVRFRANWPRDSVAEPPGRARGG